jgi:RNA polymerase sigma-70 factor (ECF subfamily)
METSRTSVNDLAKACACSSDAREWEEFLRRARPVIAVAALRVCRLWMGSASPAMVDDIVQEVFLRLCEQERIILRKFEPRGVDSILGLLRIVSISTANDYFRRVCSAKRGGKEVTVSIEDDSAPSREASTLQTGQMQQSVLLAQLDRILISDPEAIGERDRSIFWFYYLQGFTAEEIAGIAGVGLSAKGVESALRRVANWLRGKLKERHGEGQLHGSREETIL